MSFDLGTPAAAELARKPAAMQPQGDATQHSKAAAAFLKALSHKGRLSILFHLCDGERSVGELERLVGCRQAAVSQQLARLRSDGLVACRRSGKAFIYRLNDPRVGTMIALVNTMFAKPR